jgi:hypothetical protein
MTATMWTKDAPKADGWYWWRESSGAQPDMRRVELAEWLCSICPEFHGRLEVNGRPVEGIGGEWQGPLKHED